jgi:hypothetical protein
MTLLGSVKISIRGAKKNESGHQKGSYHLVDVDIGVDSRTKLNCVLNKYFVRVLNGFGLLRKESDGGNETLG